MSIITTSYFIGDLDLPSRTEVGPAENLAMYISRYEPYFLEQVLGYSFAKDFQAAYAASVLAENPVALTGKWADLLNGAEYDVDDITYKWSGFRQGAPFYLSPIANYVYWRHRRDTATRTGKVGENAPQVENATLVGPMDKMVNAWNEMVKTLGEYGNNVPGSLRHFLDNNLDTYPEWNTAEINVSFFLRINNLGL